MSVELGKKKEIIKKFAINEEDTGSPDVQVAILTKRIGVLTSHLAKNKKDYHSQRGLMLMVGRRKRLLAYLRKKDSTRYEAIIKNLNIRK
ncbi:MAG TPA: 30S ribosomal protein S15 [Alphaproteobacteria bacterium]|nr:30S ribosomal protein S15 [Rickettsiales bacterium]HAE75337.1 30S ribosomal protein S15 [Alphaproteobacteria bacterium]|tara:strand:- start:4866 stop:5135 length:270 start_codon:yes stop_codon:yes gene_type:complete